MLNAILLYELFSLVLKPLIRYLIKTVPGLYFKSEKDMLLGKKAIVVKILQSVMELYCT